MQGSTVQFSSFPSKFLCKLRSYFWKIGGKVRCLYLELLWTTLYKQIIENTVGPDPNNAVKTTSEKKLIPPGKIPNTNQKYQAHK